jgi:hypothetical protein
MAVTGKSCKSACATETGLQMSLPPQAHRPPPRRLTTPVPFDEDGGSERLVRRTALCEATRIAMAAASCREKEILRVAQNDRSYRRQASDYEAGVSRYFRLVFALRPLRFPPLR